MLTMTIAMRMHHVEMMKIENDQIACLCGQPKVAASNADMRINSCQLMQTIQGSR